MKNERIIPEILGWATDTKAVRELAFKKEEAYRAIVRSEGIEVLPGVRAFLTALTEADIPCAIGSSTPRENLRCVRRSLEILGLGDVFKVRVASEDVAQGKPHPDVFLKAAHRLGLTPPRCLVLEDAHVWGLKRPAPRE